MEDQKKKKELPSVQVADRWNISHMVDVDDHDAWKIAFQALMTATFMLDRTENHILSLEFHSESLIEESNIYLAALHMLCQRYNLDLEDVISQATRGVLRR
jgi:hypothetical protein